MVKLLDYGPIALHTHSDLYKLHADIFELVQRNARCCHLHQHTQAAYALIVHHMRGVWASLCDLLRKGDVKGV